MAHVDVSWPELVSKIRCGCESLTELVVDDGPDSRAAAAIWKLLTAPEHCAVVDRCDVYLERHGLQLESLCRQIVARGPFGHVVEFGAGKALLGRVLQELMPGAAVTSIEINEGVLGFDGAHAARIVQDVNDTERVVQLLRGLQKDGRVCVVAKHLCGSATDALLRALVLSSVDAVFVAPCCHSKIKAWDGYCNAKFLADRGFASHEWPMLIKLLAVSRLPLDTTGDLAAERCFSSWRRWESTFGGRAAMLGLGRRARLLIEEGRAELLRAAGFHAQVVEYAPATSTSENMLIIAESAPKGVPAAIRMPRSGLILHADGGALRVAQYLMELRGAAAAQGGDLLWLSIVPCSDDAVAILGLDVEHLLASVKENAALLAQLRVVSNIYPFSSSVLSLDELPFPPQVQGPFRLAVTPRSLMSKVLEMASAAGMELSPKQFSATVSVCRLWDGSLGYSCLPRGTWNPVEDLRSWEACPLQLQGEEAAVCRILYRLEEWRSRLGVIVSGAGVLLHTHQEEAWRKALEASGAKLASAHEASIVIVDWKRSFSDGLALLAESPAPLAIAVIPIAVAAKQGGGKASRASQMLEEVGRTLSGKRLSAHHLLSNRDQERTIVLRSII
mmetsp:Transcript_36216/g.117070  ORF Transcript_36216/g.117070 Transcript_36216/m.117070 type:complete len:617 (-) Transcript_36216:37-1887(-)|eukprot:CAMPEP_0203954640 /NCGR_PEP_ID=MMETSP0359-20131031/87569_1 /ASSEMBLY_ACC=CAM_ASM_000338 /TAXON_ID=268821 /ORGANISM="Scrippsiella Hangoei, Strain SHTV-5" /LENGTH=616 /DNA_ID=CAMNT_0050888175 /DNA_START=52 /DNA_END=1902 /DNA_ORIENTATION=+